MITENILKDIIKQQSLIIGERLAKERAEDSGVVKFKSSGIEEFELLENQPKEAIQRLVASYEVLFGRASVDVCIEIIRRYPADQTSHLIPDNYRN